MFRKPVRESNPDLVAGPGCFLGPAFKALLAPPRQPRRCVSWSDADPVIAILLLKQTHLTFCRTHTSYTYRTVTVTITSEADVTSEAYMHAKRTEIIHTTCTGYWVLRDSGEGPTGGMLIRHGP